MSHHRNGIDLAKRPRKWKEVKWKVSVSHLFFLSRKNGKKRDTQQTRKRCHTHMHMKHIWLEDFVEADVFHDRKGTSSAPTRYQYTCVLRTRCLTQCKLLNIIGSGKRFLLPYTNYNDIRMWHEIFVRRLFECTHAM